MFLVRYKRFRNRYKKLISPDSSSSAEQLVFRNLSTEFIKPKLERVTPRSYMEKVIMYGFVVVS
jgi:hypothetical protein